MMTNLLKKILVISLMINTAASVAQTLPVVNIDMDPKTISLGFVDVVSDNVESSVFANPAMMAFSDIQASAACSYGCWQPNTFKEHRAVISGSLCITEKLSVAAGFAGGLGIPYDLYDDYGNHNGQYRPKNYNIKVGSSYKMLPYLSVGLNVGFIDNIMSLEYSDMAVTTDVFLTSCISDFKFAVGAKNWGFAWNNNGQVLDDMPIAFSAGGSYSRSLYDIHDVGLYTQYEFMSEDAMATSIGLSYSYSGMLSLRMGGRLGYGKVQSLLTAGCGISLGSFEINLAYVLPMDEMNLSNTCSLSLVYLIR